MSNLYVTNPALEPLIAAHSKGNEAYIKEYYGQFLPMWPAKYKERQFSLSTLQRSPQQSILTFRNKDKIKTNAASNHWSLFGHVIHEMMENYPHGVKERRYGYLIRDLDVLVHHKSDLILPDKGSYTDFKTSSVSSMAYDKTKWEEQLNFGVWLAENHGWYVDGDRLAKSDYHINEINVVVLLLDWRPNKHEHLKVSPEGSMVISIPKWEPERVVEWFRSRAAIHIQALEGEIPECTEEERWERGGWKVYGYKKVKKGEEKSLSSKALTSKSFPTEEEAREWAGDQEVKVKWVGGTAMNCEYYCSCRDFCPQFNQNRF